MKTIFATFTMILFAAGLVACNTLQGVGKDVEAVGQALGGRVQESKDSSAAAADQAKIDKADKAAADKKAAAAKAAADKKAAAKR